MSAARAMGGSLRLRAVLCHGFEPASLRFSCQPLRAQGPPSVWSGSSPRWARAHPRAPLGHQAGISGRRTHGHTGPVWCGPPGVRAARGTAGGLLPTHFIKTHAEPALALLWNVGGQGCRPASSTRTSGQPLTSHPSPLPGTGLQGKTLLWRTPGGKKRRKPRSQALGALAACSSCAHAWAGERSCSGRGRWGHGRLPRGDVLRQRSRGGGQLAAYAQ